MDKIEHRKYTVKKAMYQSRTQLLFPTFDALSRKLLHIFAIPSHFTLKAYFESGWLFFAPYLALYLGAWPLKIPLPLLTPVFQLLHLGHLLFFFIYLKRVKHAPLSSLFWILLFLAFLIPGAYLEYPTDPWEHFRRIFEWQIFDTVGANPNARRFNYYWAWTWGSPFPILWRRHFLGLYGAFWQWLVCYQFYRLCIQIGLKKSWANLQVLGFIAFFGTNLFSFRYYTLSATPLAYLCYLEVVRLLVGFEKDSIPKLSYLVILLLLMGFSHPQSLFFTLIALSTYFCYYKLKSYPSERQKSHLLGIVVFFAMGIGFGVLFHYYAPKWNNDIDYHQLSHFGGIRFWNTEGRFFETLGIHGSISIFFAILLFFKSPFLSLLFLSPLLLCLFPPIALAYSSLVSADALYRILYVFPSSFWFILGFQTLFETFIPPLKNQTKCWIVTLLMILAFGINGDFPWRGRLYFQFHVPSKERSLVALDSVADWLARQRLNGSPLVLTDDATGFVLTTHLGTDHALIDRVHPMRSLENQNNRFDFFALCFLRYRCGYLLLNAKEVSRQIPPSKIAISSKHFPSEYGELKWHQSKLTPMMSNYFKLDQAWNVVTVSPFYTLMTPGSRPIIESDLHP